jgi:hypothetical protein
VSGRGKRVLIWTTLVVLVVGVAAYFVRNAPPQDHIPVAKTFLQDLEAGRHVHALTSGVMEDKWDLFGIIAITESRQRRLGRLLKLERTGPVEEVDLPPGLADGRGRRVPLKGTFERGTNAMVFTFARRGTTWVVRDFEFEPTEPLDGPGRETHTRRVGMQMAQTVGQFRWPSVHERMVRPFRIANPVETWSQDMQAKFDDVGAFERVEERAWTYADGRGTFAGRLVFEKGPRDVELDLVYDPSEGRVVVTRLTLPR